MDGRRSQHLWRSFCLPLRGFIDMLVAILKTGWFFACIFAEVNE